MKTIAILLMSLTLVACSTPVVKKPEFPKPPEHLMRPVPDLKTLPQTAH